MGQYRVIRKLAAGGMAEVFLAKLIGAGGFEKPVAIKRMLPEIAREPKNAEAFLREARLCVHLAHPNVVQVLDFGTTSGQPYLVMELVDGADLRKVANAAIAAGSPLTEAEAVYIVACVAEALGYAHEAVGPNRVRLNVVHRDVNPANVLVSVNGEVKLADFGVARAADGREATQANLVKGKLGYLAPELLTGAEARHESDIFLAGLLLYELLVRRPLFSSSGSPGQILAAIAAHDEKKVTLPLGLAPELMPILQRALSRDPAARHPHARELAEQLRAVLSERRWRVGPAHLARRMAALFPDRKPLDVNESAGVPLRSDAARAAVAPGLRGSTSSASPAQAVPEASGAAGQQAAPASRAAAVPGRRRLGEMLKEAGLITESQLQNVLARQRLEGGKVGEWVVSLDYAPDRAVLAVLARQLGVQFVSDEKLMQMTPPPALLERFTEEHALKLLALPIGEREGAVFVAMTDPGDLGKVDVIRFQLGTRIQPVVCTEFGLRRAISRHYGGRGDGLKWRQLDSSDPLAIYTSRMVDFDADGRRIGGEPPRTPSAAAMPPRTMTPQPLAFLSGSPAHGGVAPALGGPLRMADGSPAAATPGGYSVAYVPAGLGPDGQPVFVAVSIAAPAGSPGSGSLGPPASVAVVGSTPLVDTRAALGLRAAEPAAGEPAGTESIEIDDIASG